MASASGTKLPQEEINDIGEKLQTLNGRVWTQISKPNDFSQPQQISNVSFNFEIGENKVVIIGSSTKILQGQTVTSHLRGTLDGTGLHISETTGTSIRIYSNKNMYFLNRVRQIDPLGAFSDFKCTTSDGAVEFKLAELKPSLQPAAALPAAALPAAALPAAALPAAALPAAALPAAALPAAAVQPHAKGMIPRGHLLRMEKDIKRFEKELLDPTISSTDKELSQKGLVELIDQYKIELTRVHDLTIVAKDAEITTKNAEIAAKNAEITAKNAEIAAKDAEIERLTAKLSTCGVCFEEYNKTTKRKQFLECGHILCLECAARMTSLGGGGPIKCPHCRVSSIPKILFDKKYLKYKSKYLALKKLLK
jgi:hypothetical protein